MHEERLMPAGIDQRMHCAACISPPPVILRNKYPIHFKTIRMPPAPGCCRKRALNKNPEDAIGQGITFLLVISFPYLLCKGKLPGPELLHPDTQAHMRVEHEKRPSCVCHHPFNYPSKGNIFA